MTKTPIADRIAATLTTSDPTSDAVRDVLQEARGEAARLAGLESKLRELSRRPTTPQAEARIARAKLDDLAFEADRIRAGVEELETALARAEAREAEAARLAAYDAALAERDAAAEELRTVYPEAAAVIAKVLARVAAIDTRLAHLNRNALPDGRQWIAPVETVVRGISENGHVIGPDGKPGVSQASTLADAVNLPALDAAAASMSGEAFWRKGGGQRVAAEFARSTASAA